MSEDPRITEINCETGEVVVRPLTTEEIAQAEADKAARLAVEAANQEALAAAALEAQEKAALRQGAIDKLAALGLTEEEIAAILSA